MKNLFLFQQSLKKIRWLWRSKMTDLKPIANGFTMAELAVGMVVTLSVGVMATSFIVRSNEQFSQDSQKVEITQTSNAVLNLLAQDINRAGELVNSDNFAAIQLWQNVTEPDPTHGNTSTTFKFKLTLRYALSSEQPLCLNGLDVSKNPTEIVFFQAKQADDNTICNTGTNNYKVYPSSLQKWRKDTGRCQIITPPPDYTSNNNPCTLAGFLAVHDRATGRTSMFSYTGDEETNSGPTSNKYRLNGIHFEPALVNGVLVENCVFSPNNGTSGAQVYAIEEKTYYFDESRGQLWLQVNKSLDPEKGPLGQRKPWQLLADNIHTMNVSLATIVNSTLPISAPGNELIVNNFARNAENCANTTENDKWRSVRQVLMSAVMLDPEIAKKTSNQSERSSLMQALATSNPTEYNKLKINQNVPVTNAFMDNSISP
jgi:hypothetical protein